MNMGSGTRKGRKSPVDSPSDIAELLAERVVGQPAALKLIVPYIDMYRAGLSPEGRPAGVFLLLGPTGTGKTKTVEALAGILHNSEKNVLRLDCGEFQMDHEVAKLIGAPPGYLGHRETQPMLNQQKLEAVVTDKCDLALVLFDEIEKAAPSLTRLLLGVLDKAVLRLGDNTPVNFEKSLIFLTSNLGAREMMNEIQPDFGFQSAVSEEKPDLRNKLQAVGMAAVRRKFSPEFINRIDAVITYQPLDQTALSAIVDRQITELQKHVNTRLADRCFSIELTPEARAFLLAKGTSKTYGARELKRTIHRHLTQPLATLVASGRIEPGSAVAVEASEKGDAIIIKPTAQGLPAAERPVIVLVDDNHDLLGLFKLQLARHSWTVHTAERGREAKNLVAKHNPNVVVLDYLLPDANGVELAASMRAANQNLEIIIATGAELASEDELRCERYGFPVLRKPFLGEEMADLIRARLFRTAAAAQ
jgi:ATP-dependent Clp protease ATP-binding subunit ClpA